MPASGAIMEDVTRRGFLIFASAAVVPTFLPVTTDKLDPTFQRAKSAASDRATLEENRARLFAMTWGDWEVYYGGHDSAADGVPTWAVWDNPIDDDGLKMLEAGGGFRLNTPRPGIMSVDRSFPDPLGRKHGLGSVISRRDEYLRPADGLTLEFRVRIRPPTQPAGFMAYYRRSDGVCHGLHLDQKQVRGGGYGTSRGFDPASVKDFDTTAFHTYRMVVPPNSTRWSAYIDGKHAFDAQANSYRVTSLHKDDHHPTIIIGGEKGNKTTRYELAYVAYRRGAFRPGEEKKSPPRKRTPPPLPVHLTPASKEDWRDLSNATRHDYPKHLPPAPYPAEWRSARPGYRTTAVSLDPPARNKGDLTVEWTLKVHPDSEPRGFSTYLRDGMGTIGMLWSPDKVELSLGAKNVGYYKDIPIGIRGVMMDTADRAHTYRLVRRANTMYAHLYIDDNPIPALYDQHLDASMSGFFDAPPPALLFGDTLNNWGKGRVTIERLRWSSSAFAPAKG